MSRQLDIKGRFWRRVVVKDSNECWLWTGAKFDTGYGKFQINRKRKRAHVFSFELESGPVPEGLFVLHTCDTPACVNPKHLYAGTIKQNHDDMISRGRQAHFDRRGTKNSRAKLSEEDVMRIRVDGRPALDVATAYSVSRDCIYNIRDGRTWAHLEQAA